MARLTGLRVLVTGGGSGIGRTIAARLAQEGARVHVCDVSAEALEDLSATRPGLLGTCADVGSEADVDRLFADVSTHLGGLDVLVNNAGIAGPTAAVDEVLPADWHRTLDVNLTGVIPVHASGSPLAQAGGRRVHYQQWRASRRAWAFRTAARIPLPSGGSSA